jgi:hypothetical protein
MNFVLTAQLCYILYSYHCILIEILLRILFLQTNSNFCSFCVYKRDELSVLDLQLTIPRFILLFHFSLICMIL